MRTHLLSFGAISVLLAMSAVSIFGAENQPLYLDANESIENRVADLLSRLTLEEKISIIHANSKFTTAAIPRLGIPRRWLDDGRTACAKTLARTPGIPPDARMILPPPCPAGICLAATWNPELG